MSTWFFDPKYLLFEWLDHTDIFQVGKQPE